MEPRPTLDTAPPPRSVSDLRRARALRWVFAVALVAFLAFGVIGCFGPTHRAVSAQGGGIELTVRYPSVSRPGLASAWSVEVRSTDGAPLPGTVQLATTSDYFDLFDENGLDPDPAAAMSDGERLIWEIEPAPGAAAVTVDYDARIEPGMQLTSRRATTSVLVDGVPVVSVTYRTRVLP